MADTHDKTEAATAKRQGRSVSEGQVARSPELTGAVILMGVILACPVILPFALSALQDYLRRSLAAAVAPEANLRLALWRAAAGSLFTAAPFILVASAVSFVWGLYQRGGLYFSPEKLAPDFTRLVPSFSGGRWSKPESWIGPLLVSLKIALVGWTAWTILRADIPALLIMPLMSPSAGLNLWGSTLGPMFRKLAALLLALGAADYLMHRWRGARDMRMSKQEVSQEHKESEGSPVAKSRRRGEMRQMLRAVLSKAAKADVVVTNPTHFAVALSYRPGTTAAPVVLAKGRDLVALRIMALAREKGIPVVPNPILARALYRAVQVDHPIPADLFRAVAEVYAFIYRTRPLRAALAQGHS
jgi:flagellar biosynthetic protein FlhB